MRDAVFVILDAFEDHQTWYTQEYLGLAAFHLLLEDAIFLANSVHIDAELDELVSRARILQLFLA